MPSIKALVGLGNPGPKYDRTRHNAGFWFLDEVAERLGVSLREDKKLGGAIGQATLHGRKLILFKPLKFMNLSGGPVGAMARYYGLQTDQLLVAYDELDLEPGVVRLKRGGGHGGHNGLRDLFTHLPDPEFYRLRIGIGHPGHKSQVVSYVLKKPSKEHEIAIDEAIIRAADEIPNIVEGRLDPVMKRLHTKCD